MRKTPLLPARYDKKYALEPPHFISTEHDPQRIIMAEKICNELEFVYQYPDPNLMLPTEG